MIINMLFHEDAILKRINDTALFIRERYRVTGGNKEIVLVILANGGLRFGRKLIKLLEYYNVPFISEIVRANSYEGTERKDVHIRKRKLDVTGKLVFVIDDIIDSGETMQSVTTWLGSYAPHRLYVITLLTRKPGTADFEGFDISEENRFVIGFGMDYNGNFRGVNDIYTLVL